ncbi:chromosome segregation ATPase [Methanosarcina sp. DH1]|uniref:chromosome segregation ATPase n=1 Tax=Methanosarcina sp. DH1 TaxID=2605695 RepID=UPI001E46E6C7|nr:chromosome segregation ATPase [Methanosarcina sp. DH1]
MKTSKNIQFLVYLTIMLILLSIIPEVSFAAKDSSNDGKGNQDKYMREDARNSSNNETGDTGGTGNFTADKERLQNNFSIKDRNRTSEQKQEKNQLREELQVNKQEYKEAKGEFLKIRNLVRAGKLDPNSKETLNATKLYLNSSINYMIAHLSNVKSNVAYSNGNGTDEKAIAVAEKIKLLEAEKAEIANASSQEELLVVIRSVSGVWNNAEKTSIESAGQTVSERIGEFIEKSENLSKQLRTEVDDLNETGVNTTDLDTKLASYNFYINSAKENKEAADAIYSGENVTRKDMEKANGYLRQSLSDINAANNVIRQILNELKEYETENSKETGVEDNQKTALNNTENMTGTNNSSIITDSPESGKNVSYGNGKSHSSGNGAGTFTKKS